MLFLLNEIVLNVEGVRLPRHLGPRRLQALSFYDLIRLGQELYAEAPLLYDLHPARAERLAALIMAKAPAINGAQFVAPDYGCAIDEVHARFANIEMGVLAGLSRAQRADGRLALPVVDRMVWKRLAA